LGRSTNKAGAGVSGENTFVGGDPPSDANFGIDGRFGGTGVNGSTRFGIGVAGQSETYIGVRGDSTTGPGVHGQSLKGPGVSAAGHPAGHFDGDVEVTGDILLTGADCAEEFDVSEAADVEPGIVMVINQDGVLQPSRQAYDKRVAGVVSGAGNYRSGITLDKQPSRNNRSAIALVGKVYCKVDAQYAPIEVGDLLTTSPSHGYAMKATDPYKAFGAVIGKALSSLDHGCGLIPILVTLQ
jgi:hypothetical protein